VSVSEPMGCFLFMCDLLLVSWEAVGLSFSSLGASPPP